MSESFSELPMVSKGQAGTPRVFRLKPNSYFKILMHSDKIFMISKSDKILPDPLIYWMTHR